MKEEFSPTINTTTFSRGLTASSREYSGLDSNSLRNRCSTSSRARSSDTKKTADKYSWKRLWGSDTGSSALSPTVNSPRSTHCSYDNKCKSDFLHLKEYSCFCSASKHTSPLLFSKSFISIGISWFEIGDFADEDMRTSFIFFFSA